MTCSNCGADVAPGCGFCRVCGTLVDVPAKRATVTPAAPGPRGRRLRVALVISVVAAILTGGAAAATLIATNQDDDSKAKGSATTRSPGTTAGQGSPPEEDKVRSTPSEDRVPALPTLDDPAQLAAEVNRADEIIHDPSARPADIEAAGRFEQLATRALLTRRDLRRATFDDLTLEARTTLAATMRAANALSVLSEPQKDFPDWEIVEPASPDRLLRYYRDAEDAFGVGWEYLAAIHLVETRMGRVRGTSSSGAQGPMQFLPATWARYGEGDINSARDSIMAAGRLLVANGAPAEMSNALYRYNPSDEYVRAISQYARLMRADERAFYGLHGWQVLYKHVDGTVILPVGYPEVEPERIS